MILPLSFRGPALGRTIAALATWTVVFGVSCYVMFSQAELHTDRVAAAVAVQVTYLLAMLSAFSVGPHHRSRARLALLVQLSCGLLAGLLVPADFLPIYTIVWIAMLPSFVESRSTAFVALGAVMLAWFGVRAVWWQDPTAASETLLWSVFHLFALHTSLETRAASRARDRAATLNRELVAAHHLLDEASRSEERTRIARDLHDLLGHHLTALILELQVAGHRADGEARERVDRCQALARLLMGDVREAVSRLREDGGLDVAAALRELTDRVPRLRVHLCVPDELPVRDLETASTVLRCVQEALTNSLRHAGAAECWIRVRHGRDGIALDYHDDGRVQEPLRPGHGLTGMRERVEALRGTLRLERTGKALALAAHLPPPSGGSA